MRAIGGKHVRSASSHTSATEQDPLLAFYRKVNPDAELGEAVELLSPLDWTNTVALGRRIVTSLLRPRSQASIGSSS